MALDGYWDGEHGSRMVDGWPLRRTARLRRGGGAPTADRRRAAAAAAAAMTDGQRWQSRLSRAPNDLVRSFSPFLPCFLCSRSAYFKELFILLNESLFLVVDCRENRFKGSDSP